MNISYHCCYRICYPRGQEYNGAIESHALRDLQTKRRRLMKAYQSLDVNVKWGRVLMTIRREVKYRHGKVVGSPELGIHADWLEEKGFEEAAKALRRAFGGS